MRISFIYPKTGVYADNKNWMDFVADKLGEEHTVFKNTCPVDVDVIIGMSIGMISLIKSVHILYPNIPLVLYNWDMHPLLQPEVGKWDEIGWDVLLKEAIDVWTQTHYHADLSEDLSGVRHFVMPMCAIDSEFTDIETNDGEYALMASRRVPYKGFDLFENGCKEVGVEFISRHPDFDNRDEYIKDLANCKVLVVASEEEANAPMSTYEAAFLKKPLLLSSIQANIEDWEECAIYFTGKDDFKYKLKEFFDGKYDDMGQKAYDRARKLYTLDGFTSRISNRLCEVL